ncbi:MAG: ATP-binding protein [Proteobacteria bacterium]|nr:ATP-binding protein [Pseudomonadota bacterium]MBU1546325.1 ATP-binding protein [Pseudomonadota bacterium]MBU2619017.1 ATP-binding protein [Pseudomonadota bacterium]
MTRMISEALPEGALGTHAPVRRLIGELHHLGRQDSFASQRSLAELTDLFDADNICFAVVVWDTHGEPLAIVSRDTLARELNRPFVSDLYKHRTVENLLEKWRVPVLVIAASETIEKAVADALSRPATHRYEPILVRGGDEWFILETHALLAQQCEVLSATIDEVKSQRREILIAQRKSEQLHEQLVTASRDAGRAEVATGVIHNVGNVLNSVNASAALISRTLQESKLGNLGKALTLFREHENDLSTFLTADEKGQRLPGYLHKLAEALLSERETVVTELHLMERSIEHIRQIVQMQQSYARHSVILEPMRPADVMEDALRVNLVSFDRHNVKVQREYQNLSPVKIDKHKVLQILINLISNAKNSVKHKKPDERLIITRILSCEINDVSTVRFQIADNGIGIEQEHLTRIFSHGFTTRKDGHGFGLHSSANTAREIGGTLCVASDGPGLGAVFTLDIPVQEE